jgi:hypothetical protein
VAVMEVLDDQHDQDDRGECCPQYGGGLSVHGLFPFLRVSNNYNDDYRGHTYFKRVDISPITINSDIHF